MNEHRPRFQEIEGQQWFIYRQGMEGGDIPQGITHVLVEEGTTSIEGRTFCNGYPFEKGKYDSLQHVRIAKSVQGIGEKAFCDCKNLVTVEIPDDSKLVEIGQSAFLCCRSLTGDKMNLPASLRNIGDFAFTGTSLVKLFVQGDSNHLSQMASIGCSYMACTSLKEVDLSSCPNLRTFVLGTFARCASLKTVLLPPYLARIGNRVFRGCTSLEVIVFPKTLQSLGRGAFLCCTQLQSLKFRAAFLGCTALGFDEFESVASIRGTIES
mmetsp:Transcript_11619/g.32164  ORF Transcript_11619/g.32164 Transcript_11619/m.32164 type:complete len:267 (-) Transcript_11619:236-1036(-)